jgi:hypothetical protein
MKLHELRVGQSLVIHSKPSILNGKPIPEKGELKAVEEVKHIFDRWQNRAIRLTIVQQRKRPVELSFYYHNIDKIEMA